MGWKEGQAHPSRCGEQGHPLFSSGARHIQVPSLALSVRVAKGSLGSLSGRSAVGMVGDATNKVSRDWQIVAQCYVPRAVLGAGRQGPAQWTPGRAVQRDSWVPLRAPAANGPLLRREPLTALGGLHTSLTGSWL